MKERKKMMMMMVMVMVMVMVMMMMMMMMMNKLELSEQRPPVHPTVHSSSKDTSLHTWLIAYRSPGTSDSFIIC